jgi:hypothetical protein
MQFLSDRAFATPAFLVKPDVLRRIEPVGVLERIRTSQQRVLTTVLAEPRIARLVEQEAVDGAAAYRPTEFFADLRRAVWREIDAAAVQIDPYRRNLQRAYLDAMGQKVNSRTSSESRPLARGELRTLDVSVRAAMARAADRTTRLHLQDVRDQIARILDPKFAPPAAAPGPPIFLGLDEPTGCWLDYAILIER